MLSLVNVISRLMWSDFGIPLTTAYYIKTTGYCYHSVNVITFGLAQSDHIKRLLLYNAITHSVRRKQFLTALILYLIITHTHIHTHTFTHAHIHTHIYTHTNCLFSFHTHPFTHSLFCFLIWYLDHRKIELIWCIQDHELCSR